VIIYLARNEIVRTRQARVIARTLNAL
jgi:hypothetical protein